LAKFGKNFAKDFRIWSRRVLYRSSGSGVNFINILSEPFLQKCFFATFLLLKFGFVSFWRKNFGKKAAHKMLMKLTPGFD